MHVTKGEKISECDHANFSSILKQTRPKLTTADNDCTFSLFVLCVKLRKTRELKYGKMSKTLMKSDSSSSFLKLGNI